MGQRDGTNTAARKSKPAAMAKEPWLEGLPEVDWVEKSPSCTHSPTQNSSPSRPWVRNCQGCVHRARWAQLAQREAEEKKKKVSQVSPRAPKQTPGKRDEKPLSRPCKLNSPDKTPSKIPLRSNAKLGTPSRDKPTPAPMKKMVTSRAPPEGSINTSNQGTVQVRPVSGDAKGTPEWRRRLVRGEMPSEGQRDLFSPMGLENVFKPPAKASEAPPQPASNRKSSTGDSAQGTRKTATNIGSSRAASGNKGSEKGTSTDQAAEASRLSGQGPDGESKVSCNRSVSEQEDSRNEGLTPISLSQNNTVARRTASGVLESALKRLSSAAGTPKSADRDDADNDEGSPIEDIVDVTVQSLPPDLSMGTQEDSGSRRNGSFRQRPLPQVPVEPQSSMLTASESISSSQSLGDSAVMDSQSTHSVTSSTLTPPPQAKFGSRRRDMTKMNSSGSPLKLFGDHDTFTNGKLLQRMSQFEETLNNASDEDDPTSSLGVRRLRRNRSRASTSRGSSERRSTQKVAQSDSQEASYRRMSRFGSGQLDHFGFAKETDPRLHLSEESDVQLQLRSRRSVRSSVEGSRVSEGKLVSGLSRRVTPRGLTQSRSRPVLFRRSHHNDIDAKRTYSSQGRRSILKRRRTVEPTAEDSQDDDLLQDSPNGPSLLEANMQRRGIDYRNFPQSVTAHNFGDSPAGASWDESPRESNPPLHGSGKTMDERKRSLTTQDFLDEATKVMSIIRAKGRYKGGLASVEEMDNRNAKEDQSDSSRESLSRPPSREGKDDLRTLREPRQLNPRVLSHLRKYADKDDTDGLMMSMMSLRLDGKPDSEEARQSSGNFNDSQGLPPRKRKYPSLSDDEEEDEDMVTGRPGDSTRNSVPTASSGASNTKGVIQPELVSHLIPDQVNGLIFDPATKSWVKRKSGSGLGSRSRSEDSEDDPFGSIPDLSVDSLEERTRMAPTKSEHKKTDSQNTASGVESLDGQKETKDVEHEIRINEGRAQNRRYQPRVVTISFSSPLVSHIAYTDARSEAASHRDENQADYNDSTHGPRHTSPKDRPFRGRPVFRIDEQPEDSKTGMSIVRRDASGQVTSTPSDNDPWMAGPEYHSFHLSPLPDFTVNQLDDPVQLELSYIAQRTHPSSLRQIHGAFALATEDLIKHITDVEPYEPYWEDVRRLNLSGRGLVTLHRLNEFCPRLEELDVSENELGHLTGAPSTLRHIRVQRNHLTDMTAWGHLTNLQYLDVSNNELERLDGFSGLIHLRELRANNNKINNIDGILGLDGLLRLELRGNELATVDFGRSELTRLGEIDLGHNQLTVIQNLECLPALERLNVSFNHLEKLCTKPLQRLKELRLSYNRFRSFDAAAFPGLELLYVDGNYLMTVQGLEQCSHLEVLSLREQFADGPSDSAPTLDLDIGVMGELRKLFLSSNRLSTRTLQPSIPVRSLQLLDVASCGLRTIPSGFGKRFPNLRVLNLNFNALSDLSGIIGIRGLSRLTAVNNRVSRLRMVCQVVSQVGRVDPNGASVLRSVDLRGNPLTVGFYSAPITGHGRGEGPVKKLEYMRHQRKGSYENGPEALATIGGKRDIAVDRLDDEEKPADARGPEIDDPYTVPPADAQADQKYRARLDESTKMRRKVLELMMYAGSGGAIQMLDGLELKPILEEDRAEMNRIWDRLEELGVLKQKSDGTDGL